MYQLGVLRASTWRESSECVKWCRCERVNASRKFKNADKTTRKQEGGERALTAFTP